MKFIIHFEHQDGTEDSIIIQADTIEEIREIAREEIEKRNAKNYWSEAL